MQYGEHGALDSGEMTEWLKVHAWKVCIPQKGIVGSNPAFSAKKNLTTQNLIDKE